MGSLDPDTESKQELDDSGYVHDETAKQAVEDSKTTADSKETANSMETDEYKGTAELLDLSDDVLLYILQNLSPQDLKALGFTCARLGTLILDRTLWVDVDAGGAPLGRRRVRWLLSRALGPHTRRLRLRGYAEEAEGCLGYVNRYNYSDASEEAAASGSTALEEERYLCGGPRVYRLTQTFPRYGPGRELSPAPDGCLGPRLTLTHTALRELGGTCSALRTLELEHCVIDCQTTNIGMFPKTLTKLSLKGTKCFNLESKSFLFKIQDHLSHLEELDVSYCSWIEPACMLPLSKMPCLHTLSMRQCLKLAEFVAYASLATRYGFKKLKKLDLSGSPVGDSEVSALGWLPCLAELHLSPAPRTPRASEHAHYTQDLLPAHNELEDWEETEPEYFRAPSISEDEWMRDEEDVHGNQSRYYTTNCDDPSACILLERMIAEPVAPEEYSQVYHQFLAGHNNNVPLANPDEYRAAYRQYMFRPTHAHPPAGYSLFIRKPEENNEPGPSKRRRTETRSRPSDARPGTSTEETQPSVSTDQPSGSSGSDRPSGSGSDRPSGSGSERPTESGSDRPTKKRDSEDSDDNGPPAKRTNHTKKSKRKKSRSSRNEDGSREPRRVFEITINELNARLQAFNGGANQANAANNQGIIANNEANRPNPANAANNRSANDNTRNNKCDKKADTKSKIQDSETAGSFASNDAAIASGSGSDPVANTAGNDPIVANATGNDPIVANATGNDPAVANVAGIDPGVSNAASNVAGSNPPAGKSSGNDPAVVNATGSSPPAGNAAGNDPVIINAAGNNPDVANRAGSSPPVANAAGNDPVIVNATGNIPATASTTGNSLIIANAAGNVPGEANFSGNNLLAGNASGNGPIVASAEGNGPVVANTADNNQPAGNIPVLANAAGNNPPAGNIPVLANADGNNQPAGFIPVVVNADGDNPVDGDANANAAASNAAAIIAAAFAAGDAANNSGPARQRIFQFRQYRRPIVIEEFINVGDPEAPGILPRGVLFPGCPTRLDPAALVSDASIRRFGRAIGENINYIHIGGGAGDVNARPDRSSLTFLSVTGYRHVTDSSLLHLATAAPLLQRLDVSGTSVTLTAVERFRALRPDVEVIADHVDKPGCTP